MDALVTNLERHRGHSLRASDTAPFILLAHKGFPLLVLSLPQFVQGGSVATLPDSLFGSLQCLAPPDLLAQQFGQAGRLLRLRTHGPVARLPHVCPPVPRDACRAAPR